MSRPSKPAYDLTDAEKRDLTQLIAQGRPLPEKYRFVLFEDKREVELVWNGKTREVCTTGDIVKCCVRRFDQAAIF
jgi:site-specific DNA-methyltransferase (adenine-specific)/adenine-specific DNA-methyltransferase